MALIYHGANRTLGAGALEYLPPSLLAPSLRYIRIHKTVDTKTRKVIARKRGDLLEGDQQVQAASGSLISAVAVRSLSLLSALNYRQGLAYSSSQHGTKLKLQTL